MLAVSTEGPSLQIKGDLMSVCLNTVLRSTKPWYPSLPGREAMLKVCSFPR